METPRVGTTDLENVILALESTLRMLEPEHALRVSAQCLGQSPFSGYAAIASVVAMTSHARLGHYSEAQSSLLSARQSYADHLSLTDNQRARFVEGGHLTDDLSEIGIKDLQMNPWLYFILGHGYGPTNANGYLGDSQAERLDNAGLHWVDFFLDHREEALKTLSYLYLTNGRAADACRCLERIVLVARKYESLAPTRMEVVWPKVMLGECYWALGQQARAIACWQGARSTEICLGPDLDDWDRLGRPWIGTAKSKLEERAISIPQREISRESSDHLYRAVQSLLEAEQYEGRDASLDELGANIQRAAHRYTQPVKQAAEEIAALNRIDAYTWARVPLGGSAYWFRTEQVKGLLLQKMALLHLSNNKLALAIANYKQAMDVWPTLGIYGVMGGLQAACGLNSDARQSYQTCIRCAEEFGAVESTDDRESILEEIRAALNQLPV